MKFGRVLQPLHFGLRISCLAGVLCLIGCKEPDKGVGAAAPAPTPAAIAWVGEVGTGYDLAVESGKPMVVLFHTDWCGYCAKLEQEVLSTPEFQAHADSFVFIKANPEKDGDGKQLAEGLKIDGYPSVSIIDVRPDGLFERGRVVGFLDQEKFMAQFDKHAAATPASPQPIDQDEWRLTGERENFEQVLENAFENEDSTFTFDENFSEPRP